MTCVGSFITPSMYEVMTTSPEEFAAFVKVELQCWGKVRRDASLKID